MQHFESCASISDRLYISCDKRRDISGRPFIDFRFGGRSDEWSYIGSVWWGTCPVIWLMRQRDYMMTDFSIEAYSASSAFQAAPMRLKPSSMAAGWWVPKFSRRAWLPPSPV